MTGPDSTAVAPSVIERLLTPRELEWLVTGVHEAGHMVLAMTAGLDVEGTEIHQGWWSIETTGVVRFAEQEIEGSALDGYLLSVYGGTVAEERFLVEYGIASHEAYRRAMDHCWTDMELFTEYSRGTSWTHGRGRARATEAVDKYWSRIVMLGTIICEKKRLSAKQAERVRG